MRAWAEAYYVWRGSTEAEILIGLQLDSCSRGSAMENKRKRKAQWAAQFLVASELERNGYDVAFTMGNQTPIADLMVGHSATGNQFLIDVKGMWTQTAWLVGKPKPSRPNLFYVLTVVGKNRNNRFFVLSQAELNGLIEDYRIRRAGATDPFIGSSFDFKDALPFEEQWQKLPSWGRELVRHLLRQPIEC